MRRRLVETAGVAPFALASRRRSRRRQRPRRLHARPARIRDPASANEPTPAPWINVIANAEFGTLISESGSASTWSENAHEFRLTPWSNDPVGDANTEAFYIRDEDSGRFWSPTLLPTRGAGAFVARHGFGYSVFEHDEDGIESTLCVHVAIDAPVKFSALTLRNRSGRTRRLSVTGYLEWVLGDERAKTLMHVVTELDADTGAVFARNGYNTDFAGRTAFFDVDVDGDGDNEGRSACGDRGDFFGAAGTRAAAGCDVAVAAFRQVRRRARPVRGAARHHRAGARRSARSDVFRLGAGKSAAEALDLVRRWRGAEAAHAAFEAVQEHWRRTLGAVQVRTPDRSVNVLANGWLLYQVLASRLWGRTAFYQSSGAFGFRDQLQDVMALVHAEPELVREHLLRCASRQFRRRRRPALVASAVGARRAHALVPTITSGCRLSPAAMSWPPATPVCSTNPSIS